MTELEKAQYAGWFVKTLAEAKVTRERLREELERTEILIRYFDSILADPTKLDREIEELYEFKSNRKQK